MMRWIGIGSITMTCVKNEVGTKQNHKSVKTKVFLLRAAVLALILTCSASRAAVIFDSTTTTPDNYGNVEADGWFGQSFSMGSSSATLSSVVLSMTADNAVVPTGNFFVSLYDATGAGSTPGASLLTLSGSANPATAGDYTYTGSLLLAANTTYYVVAGVSSGSGVYEWAAHSSEDNGTIGYSDSFNSGVTWNSDNTPPGTVFTDATFNMQINGNISSVPEPAEWGLISCALLGLVCIVGRRRWGPMTHHK
jgi:hypothetical protein